MSQKMCQIYSCFVNCLRANWQIDRRGHDRPEKCNNTKVLAESKAVWQYNAEKKKISIKQRKGRVIDCSFHFYPLAITTIILCSHVSKQIHIWMQKIWKVYIKKTHAIDRASNHDVKLVKLASKRSLRKFYTIRKVSFFFQLRVNDFEQNERPQSWSSSNAYPDHLVQYGAIYIRKLALLALLPTRIIQHKISSSSCSCTNDRVVVFSLTCLSYIWSVEDNHVPLLYLHHNTKCQNMIRSLYWLGNKCLTF